MLTYFVVQSFSQGRKGAVVADQPIQSQSADHATRMADRLSRTRVAAIAFSRTGDPATGEYDEAVILASFGEIPDESQQLAIAS